MWRQCRSVGDSRCLAVHYEQLVLHPEEELRRVLSFLDLPWNKSVLHHDQFVGQKIKLSLFVPLFLSRRTTFFPCLLFFGFLSLFLSSACQDGTQH